MENSKKCCVCTKTLSKIEKQTCNFCRGRIKSALFSIENSYGLLPDEIVNRGSGGSLAGKITGTKESTIPGGDALVFTTTGRIWVNDPYMSDDDPLPVVSTLCYYEDEWRKLLQAGPAKSENLSNAIAFLIECIVWASREYSEFATFAKVVFKINGHLDSIVRNSERKLRANAPCFVCGGNLSKEYKKSKECNHFPKVEIESAIDSNGWVSYGIAFPDKTPEETIVIDIDDNGNEIEKVYYLDNWEPCGCDQGGLRFFWECDRCGHMYSDDEYFEEISQRIGEAGMNWFKSKHSANVSQCVEVQFVEGLHGQPRILVRNSKKTESLVSFTIDEWDAFIKGVKNGEFDTPIGIIHD